MKSEELETYVEQLANISLELVKSLAESEKRIDRVNSMILELTESQKIASQTMKQVAESYKASTESTQKAFESMMSAMSLNKNLQDEINILNEQISTLISQNDRRDLNTENRISKLLSIISSLAIRDNINISNQATNE